MRDRGKAVEPFPNDFSEIPCKKHPNSYSVGICPHCLKERLVNLVCSECGEQRLSSCSCSDASSSYRNSVEIGSVGRVSFLIENEKEKEKSADQVIFLRRSSSSCVQVKKTNGFWKIKRLFRKKKRNTGCDEDKSEIWVSDIMGVSRSRSLCSFRNGFRNDLDEGSDCPFSSAKISDVTGGVFLDSDKFESGGRTSLDRTYRGVFPAKESDFTAMDESAFIDLKLDLSSEVSGDHDGGSCRMSVNERGLKRGSKSHKVWKWIFKYHPGK